LRRGRFGRCGGLRLLGRLCCLCGGRGVAGGDGGLLHGLLGGLLGLLDLEIGDALFDAGDGVAVMGQDFAGLGVVFELVDAVLVGKDESAEKADGSPVLLLDLGLAGFGLLELGVELLTAEVDGAGLGGDGLVDGVPDVPTGESDEEEEGGERDGDFLHGCELGLPGVFFMIKRGARDQGTKGKREIGKEGQGVKRRGQMVRLYSFNILIIL
jgi:hypothetical protein